MRGLCTGIAQPVLYLAGGGSVLPRSVASSYAAIDQSHSDGLCAVSRLPCGQPVLCCAVFEDTGGHGCACAVASSRDAASCCRLAVPQCLTGPSPRVWFRGCLHHSFPSCSVCMLPLVAPVCLQLVSSWAKHQGLAGVQDADITACAAYCTCRFDSPPLSPLSIGRPIAAAQQGRFLLEHRALCLHNLRHNHWLQHCCCCCQCQHTYQRMWSVSCIQSCSCARRSLCSFAKGREPLVAAAALLLAIAASCRILPRYQLLHSSAFSASMHSTCMQRNIPYGSRVDVLGGMVRTASNCLDGLHWFG